MNLRILKKLSKRAAPLVAILGNYEKSFVADGQGDSYTKLRILDHDGSECLYAAVKRGTPMVGWWSGYYEREWDEESAWEHLCGLVFDHFTDWSCVRLGDINSVPRLTRRLRTPSDIFAAAQEIINARGKSVRDRSPQGHDAERRDATHESPAA